MYGDEYLKRNLTDPPRHLSGAVVIQLLFGGAIGLLGWVFFGFGMIFFWVFAMNTDPAAWWDFRGDLTTAQGVVTSVEETRFSEGGSEESDGTPVYAYHFRFSHQQQDFVGVSYRCGTAASTGEQVTVEFPAGRPWRSRICGYRTALCSPWVLFVALFPAIGLLIVLGKLRSGLRHRHLLKFGELSQGKLVSKERTNTEINDQPVYKLTFEFDTSLGQTSQIVVKTHHTWPLEDDELETLLYDPTRPSFGTTLDHLPGAPRILEDGTVTAQNTRSAYLWLVIPVITIVGHGTYIVLRYVV